MLHDAIALNAFYDTAMGQVMRRLLLRRLRKVWPSTAGQRVLGYGFAVPYLRPWLEESERVVALMPACQGVVVWPEARPLTLLADEDAFPFPDAMFDRVLIVHGLETSESIRPLLRQVWRVLAPDGRVMIVAPNRTSLWAQLDRSPLANGRPFNRSQLEHLLGECMFAVESWDNALFLPPLRTRRFVRTGQNWENVGRRLWPRLAGVHIVEASKSLYGLVPPRAVRETARTYATG